MRVVKCCSFLLGFQVATERLLPDANYETFTRTRESNDQAEANNSLMTQTITAIHREEVDQDDAASSYFAFPHQKRRCS
jgi:hypothetical protein